MNKEIDRTQQFSSLRYGVINEVLSLVSGYNKV